MDIKPRIVEIIRKVSVAQGRLRDLQEQADKCTAEIQRFSGQIDLLGELLKEESGKNINEMMEGDESFRNAIVAANKSGEQIAEGTAPPAMPERKGTKSHKSNKVVKDKPRPTALPEPDVMRVKNAPKIVIVEDEPQPEPEPGDTEPTKIKTD